MCNRIGTLGKCSLGLIGIITGRKKLPWGESWVGINLADGTQWATRNPTPVTEAELVALGEDAQVDVREQCDCGRTKCPGTCPVCDNDE